jgi:hypothetical protein
MPRRAVKGNFVRLSSNDGSQPRVEKKLWQNYQKKPKKRLLFAKLRIIL